MTTGRMRPSHIVMAVSVAVIWGMGFIVAKAAMNHFSPILLMALRFTLTALCLGFLFPPPRRLFKDLFWVALVSAAIQYSLTFNGLKGIDASTAALLVQLEVPFVILIAWVALGDRVSFRQFAGIVVSFLGAILILGEPKIGENQQYAFLVIGGALTWAIGQIMIKKMGELNGFKLISGVAIFATPQLYIASAIFESGQLQEIQSASLQAWLAVVYLGLVMTALGYAMWYRLIGLYSVNSVIPFLLLLPVTSVLGGVFLLEEVLTAKILVGGSLAIAGVGIITISRKTEP